MTTDAAAERRRRRADPAETRSVLAKIVPHEGLRRRIVEFLGESITAAHKANPAAWEVTLDYERPMVRVNTGQVFSFSIEPDALFLLVTKAELDNETRAALREAGIARRKFRILPDLRYLELTADRLPDLWPRLRKPHESALAVAGAKYRVSPFFQAHSPGVIEYLSQELGRAFPQPAYGSDGLRVVVEDLVALVRKKYPGWSGFADPRFVEDERAYKIRTAAKAADLLGREALGSLLESSEYDAFVRRLDTIGKDNNLLFRGVPMAGDLGILYQPNLDKPAFCEQVFNLLHGEGSSADRLDQYVSYVTQSGLPNKWTFPTYFLWVCHPADDVYVKPSVAAAVFSLLGSDQVLGATPTGLGYSEYQTTILDLMDPLASYKPQDATDLQGFLWVASRASGGEVISAERRSEIERLSAEFRSTYPLTQEGQLHLGLYAAVREQGQANYASIKSQAEQGEDVTDLILTKLLPHRDSQPNRLRHAWIHWAPTVNKDIRSWFEAAGWVQAPDWPQVARGLYEFVGRVTSAPDQLLSAWAELKASVRAKGFQTGLLTPILNALRPDCFLVLNIKPLLLINYLVEKRFHQTLEDYPAANATGLALVEELGELLAAPEFDGLSPADVFDAFSHWLVTVKHFEFEDPEYWKVAPGESASRWDEWREGGFIAIGWAELGDLSGLDRAAFKARRDEARRKHPKWTKAAVEQVWRFAQMPEGARIVANRGTREVVGIGTVTGPYYYVPGEVLPHRRPVEWDECELREVNQPGWKKTLIRLDKETFEAVSSGTRHGPSDGAGFVNERGPSDAAFAPEAFQLLAALTATPTREFYLSRKEDFGRLVEEPLQQLLRAVAEELPSPMTEALETEKNIFARILKNDYGRGGAWDFYWGAFYPKEGRRIADAQLYISIKRDRLEYGFSLGEHGGGQHVRFIENWKRDRSYLQSVIERSLSDMKFGRPEKALEHSGGPSWKEWLANPGEVGVQAAVHLPAPTMPAMSLEVLRKRITDDFVRLFPLVLFATMEAPVSAMRRFLGEDEPLPTNPPYSLERWAHDTCFPEEDLRHWVRAIQRKGQVIIYGPPGTGKTFMARRFATHLAGGTDGFVDIVQFHPSYAYEDFMQGIRPKATPSGGLTYDQEAGRFLDFCRRAHERQGPCVLVIDEINRANLSRVFGELMYLLEYRDDKASEIPLAGGGRFKVPLNVRLIGTMNTADRSIALVDHALRRRFAFLALQPNYEVLRRFHAAENSGLSIDALIGVLKSVNQAIANPHYELGISFFLRKDLAPQIADIWRMEIETYLEEYFFDRSSKVSEYRWDKVAARLRP